MSDYSQKLDGEYKQRARVSYIREHAHHALTGVAMTSPNLTFAEVARCAVSLTGALFDALPDGPGAEGSGAPAELADTPIPELPPEQHPCHHSTSAAEWRKWHGETATSKARWQERTTNAKEWPNGAGLQAECRGCGSTLMARWEGAPGAQLLAAEPEDTRPRVRPARVVQRVQAAEQEPSHG